MFYKIKNTKKIETFWMDWKNQKNIYSHQTKSWDMTKIDIQGITKYFCKENKQKKTELLMEYRELNTTTTTPHELTKFKTKKI